MIFDIFSLAATISGLLLVKLGCKGGGHELGVHLGRTRNGLLAFLLEQLGLEEGRHLGVIVTAKALGVDSSASGFIRST